VVHEIEKSRDRRPLWRVGAGFWLDTPITVGPDGRVAAYPSCTPVGSSPTASTLSLTGINRFRLVLRRLFRLGKGDSACFFHAIDVGELETNPSRLQRSLNCGLGCHDRRSAFALEILHSTQTYPRSLCQVVLRPRKPTARGPALFRCHPNWITSKKKFRQAILFG
jgi:hypothetical protein